jgi:pSer/pThr/pTyr-binding forkhead associated (FHA) protein
VIASFSLQAAAQLRQSPAICISSNKAGNRRVPVAWSRGHEREGTMASLIITTGRKTGKFFSLAQATNVVGRDEGLSIQVVNEFVSRKHMQVRYSEEADAYYASDMKSRHGTFVNGSRIYEEVPLTENDLVDIGGVTLMFTRKDFDDRETAMAFYREAGEQVRHAVGD